MAVASLALARVLARWWFYAALITVFALGWYVPAVGAWMTAVNATPYLVAVAFFINGFTLATETLLGNLRRWPAMLAALGILFVVSPALVLLARWVLSPGDTPLAAGFQLLGAMPPTLVSAVVLTHVARGNTAFALYVTVIANALGVFIVPLLMWLSLGLSGVRLDIAGTMSSLALTVLLPTLLGQLARQRWHRWADRHTGLLGVIAQVTILLFIITALAALPRAGIALATWGTVIGLAAALHLALLGLAHLVGVTGRMERPTRRALMLCSAQKSLIIAVFLWERLLHPLGPAYALAILPAIGYYVFELIADSALAQWWAHQPDGNSPTKQEIAVPRRNK